MLSFIRRPPISPAHEQLVCDLAAAERIAAKRLRLLHAQKQEIDRLVAINAQFAALLIVHQDCRLSESPERIAALLLRPDA